MRLPSFLRYLLVLTALGSAAAQAGVTTYADFSNTSGLTLVGDAAAVNTADGTVLRIVPDAGYRSGAFYSTDSLTLGANATFSTSFQFRMTHAGFPADGLAFVLAASPGGMGADGGGLGYEGVPNSFIVEFDTYNNGSNDNESDNHVAVGANGSLVPVSPVINVYGNGNCAGSNAAGCLSNGGLWTATITYDGARLSVRLRDSGMGADFVALSDYEIDIAAILGSNQAYAGFTAATGGSMANHDILNWTFANSAQLPGKVPEPAIAWIFGIGLVALTGLVTRRRASSRG